MTTQTKSANDTFILIAPVLNEERYIKNTISSWVSIVRNTPGSEIVVIEGGSTDGTVEILKKLSKKYDFLKTVKQEGKGHGNAIMQGYKLAINSNHKWVFQTDTDGHFDHNDFYKLWQKRSKSHFLLGYRQYRKDPLIRILITKIAKNTVNILFSKEIKDPNTPFRLMKTNCLKKTIKSIPNRTYAPNIFLTIYAGQHCKNIKQIPLKYTSKPKGNYSNIKILSGAFRTFLELITFKLSFINIPK